MHDAQLHVVENCGHVPHQEHPDIVNQLAVAFLEQ
jgi:pimeloyl-ACP methyl ester carboxylesterase